MKFILVTTVLLTHFFCFSQSADSLAIQQYLHQNKELIALDKQQAVQLFDQTFYGHQLFLFGENHGSANPQMADLLLFKQFYTKAGVRFYIAEVDDTKAWMLNNYLADGNENWLKKVFSSWMADTAQWANQSNYNKFRELHEWYTHLPPNQKFTIIGIDLVQDYSLLKEQIHVLLKEKNNAAIKLYADSLLQMTDTVTYEGRKLLGSFARRYLQVLDREKIDFKNHISINQAAIRHLVSSLSFIGSGMYRDSLMYRNMLSQAERYGLQEKKCYGFLGFYHCLQTGYNKSMPFAAALEHYKSVFSGKIVSVQMLALQSKTLLPYMAQVKQMMPQSFADKLRKENPEFGSSRKYIPYELSNDNAMMKINGIEYLAKASEPNTTTLFKLNGPNSPFAGSKLLAEVGGFQSIKLSNAYSNTTDAFQYVLLFRNSKAALPIE